MNRAYRTEAGRQSVMEIYDRLMVESELDLSERKVDTSLGSTHLFQYGSPEKPPLLLLHGTGSNGASLFYALPELGRKYLVYLPDIPGEPGKSEDRRFPCKGGYFTRWINELAAGLSLENFVIAGQSLGAWASLRYTIDYPDRIKGTVLLSPSGLAAPRASYLPRLLISLIRGERGLQGLLRRMHNSDSIDPAELEIFRILMKHTRFREDQPPLFSDKELQSVDSPLLYLAGGRDIILNTGKSMKRVKEIIPHSHCISYPEGGHALTRWTGDFLSFKG